MSKELESTEDPRSSSESSPVSTEFPGVHIHRSDKVLGAIGPKEASHDHQRLGFGCRCSSRGVLGTWGVVRHWRGSGHVPHRRVACSSTFAVLSLLPLAFGLANKYI